MISSVQGPRSKAQRHDHARAWSNELLGAGKFWSESNAFPLTPALSPEERESGTQPHCRRTRPVRRTLNDFLPPHELSHRFRATTDRSNIRGRSESVGEALVQGFKARSFVSGNSLPEGEGRGEGKCESIERAIASLTLTVLGLWTSDLGPRTYARLAREFSRT